ncbi:M48 family metallopeptidase [Natronorubrum daqingense]|uniref:Heat shock protein HtpX n=1 Tax=Natronorubrum daqingense TaxID=588898 RepID=A0A1N7BXZ3_9EURY|nr:M48 family metalloprotease [Natronorubrum daqingense]APX98191.1 peptidase M48 [Natronorubrum daqingense]SIR56192.1 heat shock protein HtpX [Natronorubrum daqingense]
MVAAAGALTLVTIGFLIGLWLVFYGIFTFFEIGYATHLATLITAMCLATIVYLEYTHLDRVEQLIDAEPVTRGDTPDLSQTTSKVAAQLDVPVPELYLSDREVPEAFVIGFRPQHIHLVISEGALNSLDNREELEAVIAHELAHVKNMDAVVMTIISVPVVVADGLRSRVLELSKDGGVPLIFTVPLGILSTSVWIIGNTAIARFSQTRERVADRAAAEVTGSPAAVATALQRLDQKMTTVPDTDLRDRSAISSLSILPLRPEEPIMLGPAEEIEPFHWKVEKRLHRLFKTHPPTAERIEALAMIAQNKRQ